MKHAIDVGYRHFDTAFLYGNEREVGEAIREKIADGTVNRENIFIVTKLWNTHHEPEKVEAVCRVSNENLGLDYIDLYLMHYPVAFTERDPFEFWPLNEDGQHDHADVDYLDTWTAMEKLVELGLVRSIGVSNFNSEQIERLLANCTIKPVTNQVSQSNEWSILRWLTCVIFEFSSGWGVGTNQSEKIGRILRWTRYHFDRLFAIGTTAARWRETGIFIRWQIGRNWREIQQNRRSSCDQIFGSSSKLQISPLNGLWIHIFFLFIFQLDIGMAVIPKSVTNSRIDENIDVFDFSLTDDEMEIIDAYNTGERIIHFTESRTSEHFPFAIEF